MIRKEQQSSNESKIVPSTNDQSSDLPRVFLTVPISPPIITMDSPEFEKKLTSAEKLNDRSYRGLVYRTYPNEPTCACLPLDKSKKQQLQSDCPSGCKSNCCSKKRQRKIKRMRGGGGLDVGFLTDQQDFTWYNSKFAPPTRLEGGGTGDTYPNVGCGKNTQEIQKNNFKNNEDYLQLDKVNPGYLAANKCKLKNVEEMSNKLQCSCPGKNYMETVLKKKTRALCLKKPCFGTDCLIKAFKDAQDFVDSIGKVPGVAGLGITESPYFGKCQESKEVRKIESKSIFQSKQFETPNVHHSIKNFDNVNKKSSNVTSNIISSNTPKKSIVQEATAFPDTTTRASLRMKKKDDKVEKLKDTENLTSPAVNIENTPCGEPKCKSRPKKIITDKINLESAEKNNGSGENLSALRKVNHKHSSRSHSSPSSYKDRKSNLKSPKIRKTKQFVYSYGNSYPTSVYGHKNCSLLRKRVPANMGWMWNQTDTVGKLEVRPGWRPGAISVFLRQMLREAKEGFFETSKRSKSAPGRMKKGKYQKTMGYGVMKKGMANNEEEEEEDIEYPPTLHVHRKDGVYYLTMYPIRQETSDVPRLDEPLNPLQLKIVKSKDSLTSSLTASDMEIEFSPPAAVNRPKKKPNVVHIETQVKHQDITDALKQPKESKKKKAKNKEKKK